MADKAFLVGINDYKSIGDLRGCINDTQRIRKLLVDAFDFKKANILVKHDREATKDALNDGWKWLLKGARPGDRLVFHFSGHGSYTVDLDDEEWEANGRDELLCLYDMDWNDPGSYLLDDEIAQWTKQIPEGVQVTFLLDCCHSGTGTRFIPPPMSRAARFDFLTSGSLSIDTVALRRSRGEQRDSKSRSVGGNEGLSPTSRAGINERTVLARFAPPPAEIQAAVTSTTKLRSIRQAIDSRSASKGEELNHVLWAGCRDDQTSADAYIGDDYYGAFTYYFCESIRELGSPADCKKVIKTVRNKLRDEFFDQVPQLEPSEVTGVVFGSISVSEPAELVPDETPEQRTDVSIDPADLRQLLALVQKLVQQSEGTRQPSRQSRDQGKRALVYVHGICEHDPGYSTKWWHAMAPHLDDDLRAELAASHHEVVWTQHVTSRNRSDSIDLDSNELAQLQLMMQAVLEDRMSREAAEQIAETRSSRSEQDPIRQPVSRAVLGIPGLDCIDDFMKYLVSDRIRQRVVDEATHVLVPLLSEGRSIEFFSHSWGTVVAYEALHQLENQGFTGRIHNWFTIGAALAISMIAKRVRPNSGNKPQIVDNWINLDARGDGVGGSILATGMKVDHEYLRLEPVGCRSVLGIVSPACAHSSYFHPDNHHVNRNIFAKWIQSR